jgi:glycosyltransferase involved in cell wall biosynthesis
MTKSRYVLISAHHCVPGMGSEHAVGWNLVSRLAREYPIILITQDNEYRSIVEYYIADLKKIGCIIEVFFIAHSSRTDGRKNNLRIIYYLTYIIYQIRVFKLAKKLSNKYSIFATHHLTIVGFREPGFLWRLKTPFVWGPVGGLVYAPKILFGELPLKAKIYQAVRNALTALQFIMSFRVRFAYKAAKRTSSFIAATPDIGQKFIDRFGGTFTWLPETGSANGGVFGATPPKKKLGRRLELLWLGGLIDIKPLGILLEAISEIPNHQERVRLTIVGDGDSRARFESIANEKKINAVFVGWLPHDEAKNMFQFADLFVLLSLKDLTTNVVFEALSSAIPVICLDHHGYSHVIDDTCGIKIPLSEPTALRLKIADELTRLIDNPSLLAPLSRGAKDRALAFTWDNNVKKISEIYQNILKIQDVNS